MQHLAFRQPSRPSVRNDCKSIYNKYLQNMKRAGDSTSTGQGNEAAYAPDMKVQTDRQNVKSDFVKKNTNSDVGQLTLFQGWTTLSILTG